MAFWIFAAVLPSLPLFAKLVASLDSGVTTALKELSRTGTLFLFALCVITSSSVRAWPTLSAHLSGLGGVLAVILWAIFLYAFCLQRDAGTADMEASAQGQEGGAEAPRYQDKFLFWSAILYTLAAHGAALAAGYWYPLTLPSPAQ